MQAACQVRQDRSGFVVGMRGHIKDTRGDRGAVDSFNRFRETRTCSRSGWKLRLGPRSNEKWSAQRCGCQHHHLHEILHATILHATSEVTVSTAGPNGHCRNSRARTRNAKAPSTISSNPHLRAGPVYQKSVAQPSIVNTAGKGYNHILKGNRSADHLRCNRITPTVCPMNCTSNRIARIAAITVSSLNKILNTKANPPKTSNETCGNFLVGCNLPKIAKKFPSNAAEYG